MSERLFIAAALYPICQAVLFGTGVVATALVLPTLADIGTSLARSAIASLVLSAPLSWSLAPLLASERERARMELV